MKTAITSETHGRVAEPVVARQEANPAQSPEHQMVSTSPQVGQLRAMSHIANGESAQVVQRQAVLQGGLPGNLKSGIESLSGIAMDDVRVHYNSSKPAQLQAHAYAQGTDIHIAPGQERHLPHEAWHVVQQKQGRVKPTLQLKGVAINDDSALEREADVMGDRAISSSPAQFKISTDSKLHSSSNSSLATPVLQGRWIQGPSKYKWHEPINGLIWFLVRKSSEGEDKLFFQIEGDPEQWDAYYRSQQDQPKTLAEWLSDAAHWEATRDIAFDQPEPELKSIVVPGPKGAKGKQVNTVTGRTQFDFHYTKLLEQDHKADTQELNQSGDQALNELSRNRKDDTNLICDKYATEFQKDLRHKKIPFLPVSFRVKSPKNTFTESSMFLNDPSHPYHGFVIGADIHYATMVKMGTQILVFDNHHPHGMPLLDFLQSIKFQVTETDAESKESRILDTNTLLTKGYVMAFLMSPDQSANFSTNPKDWPGMTIQELAAIAVSTL